MMVTTERRILPKTAFDTEYSTMWNRERDYLLEKGIRYVFVKKTHDYGLSVYKYKKTPELFKALTEFYDQVQNERSLAAAEREMRNGIQVKSPEDMQSAMEKLGLEIVVENGQPKFVRKNKEDDTE